MASRPPQYRETFSSKPAMAFFAFAGSSLFAVVALMGEQPFIAALVLALFSVLSLLVGLGASMSKVVEVNDEKNLSIKMKLLGFQFSRHLFLHGDIIRIEVDRRRSARPSFGDEGGAGTPAYRYRIDIVHRGGRFLLEASSADLLPQAERLVAKLHCPLEKVSLW